MPTTKVTPYTDSSKTKKEQVEDMFDNIANRYDFLNRLLSLRIDVKWRKQAIQFLSASSPKVILDLATGTGDFAIEALALEPEKIIGFDLSGNMLQIARNKTAQMNVSDKVDFIKGDSEQMPFSDSYFDAITVGFGVRNFETLANGLNEMYRVLKSGGKVAILEISRPQNKFIRWGYDLYFKNIIPIIGRIFSKDIRAYTYLPESVVAFPEGDSFVQILKQTGFKNVQWQPLTLGTCAFYTCEK